jgi:hypothetical protein
MKKLYILFDDRANYNVDDSTEICVARNIREIKRDSKNFPKDYVWFKYDLIEGEAKNEKRFGTCKEILANFKRRYL